MFRFKSLFFAVFTLLVGNLFATDATIEIVKNFQNTPTIIIEAKGTDAEMAKKIQKMLIGDLKVSGHFSAKEGVYSETISYSAHKGKKVDLVAKIDVQKDSKNGLVGKLSLHDINSNKLVMSKNYNIAQEIHFPFMAHKMAIDINTYIKAPTIDWMAKFVVLSKYIAPSQTEIVLADYTLTYQQTIITGGLNIFPKWANDKQDSIYFTKYLKRPTIVKYNVYTKKSEAKIGRAHV